MNTRRDLLKMFGVGAAIVPIIGGVPAIAAEAKLIEVPKLDFAPSTLSGSFRGSSDLLMSGPLAVTFIAQMADRKIVMQGKSLIVEMKCDWKTFGFRDVAGQARAEWTISGEFLQDGENLFTVSHIYE